MRYVLIVLLAAASMAPAAAQDVKKKDDKDEKKEVTAPITEIAGKNLDQWIKEIGSKDPSRREAAMRTVLQFGPNKAYLAVPKLIEQLKTNTPTKPLDLSVKVSGTIALSTALAGVKEPDPKYMKDAVAIFRGFLKDTQAVVRMRALEALPRLGSSEARAAVPEVILLVADLDTWEVRRAAIRTLTALAADPQKLPEQRVLDALYKRMHEKESSHDVRLAVLGALAALGRPGELGPKQYMIRELEFSAKDPDPMVQLYSHLALMTVKQSITLDQLVHIAAMLKHPDMTVRVQAAQALALAGSMQSVADKTVQAQVVQVLTAARSKSVGPALLVALGDPEPEVINGALSAMASMKYLDDNLTPIANLVRHKDASVRAQSAQVLGQAGTKGKLASGMLFEGLDDPDPAVVGSCVNALVQMNFAGDELQPIAKLLRHGLAIVRVQAAQALGQAGPRAFAAAPALIDGLDDRDPVVVAACIVALMNLKYVAAVPALTKLSEDQRQSEGIRIAARSAISSLQKK
jgi:HEAT repeat protein